MSKTALITGASIGIGYELCKLFAKDGHDLILVARSQDKLEALSKELKDTFNVTAHVISADLAKVGAAADLYKSVQDKSLTVNVLVNNAGIGTNGKFTDADLQSELNLIQLNITALVELCHLFGADMSKRKQGKILNVASTASFQPGPYMANYYASKAYVLSFSEALHEELGRDGVTVSALCPGPTATGFFSAADMTESSLAKSPLVMSANKVAKVGYDALNGGKAVVISGWINWLMAQSTRISPRMIVRKISAALNS